jgi:predicted permease
MRSVELPEMLFIGLGRIGQMVAPLALLSIGAQLNLERKAIAYHGRSLATGLAIKMVLFPILIAAIAWILGALPNMYGKVAVLESAMAPMMTSSILAIEADLEPELCALMVGIGVLVALFTVPLLHWVVEAHLV